MFFVLFSFASSIRIGRRDKTPLNYSDIGNSDAEQFAKNHQKTVIFYTNSNKTLKPLSHTLKDYENEVVFALHRQNPDENKYCVSFPCASAYLNGKHVRSTISAFSPIDFQFWVSHTLCEQHFEVYHPEELRQILLLPGNSIFCVDCGGKVKNIPNDKIVYYTSSAIATRLGWEPNPGLYFYRHADRRIFQIDRYEARYEQSKLVDIGFSNIKEKKFLAGFMIEHIDDDGDKNMVGIAQQLANDFSDSFGLTVFSDDLAGHISSIGGFSQICGPLFVVFNTSDFKGKRWGELDPNLVNSKTHLSNLLGKILRGEETPGYLSSPMTENQNAAHLMDIVASNFEENVYSKEYATILLLYSTCSELDQSLLVGFDTMTQVFGNRTVKFFSMDQGRNDLPRGLPLYHAYPQIVGIKAGGSEFIQLNQFDPAYITKFVNDIGVETKEDDEQQIAYLLQINLQKLQKELERQERNSRQNVEL